MNIVNKKIGELKPYENNPRHNENAVPYVVESIKRYGFKNPIIIDKDNVIVAGHTRYLASKELGLNEVPCIVADDLTEDEVKEFRLVDNRTAEMSEWDDELLASELEDIDFGDFDFGFGDEEIEADTEVIEDDYEPQDVETRCKLGDLWQLGNHRLICGDSTDVNVIERLMGGQKADITITSPPYNAGNQGYYGKDTSKYENDTDNRSNDDYRDFLNEFLHTAIQYSQYVFCNIQSLAGNKVALIDFLYDNKEVYADTMIWDKLHGQPANAYNVLNSSFEYIHIFSLKANRAIGVKEFRGTIDNVLRMGPQRSNPYADVHNATFSIDFATFFVDKFSEVSVLDVFGGTGTTLIVCEQLNRKCFMSELDPTYCDIIMDRWETFTGEKAVLINE